MGAAAWEPPSPQVRELIRQGAELAVRAPAAWLDELDEATLSAAHHRDLADDPALRAATRASNRSNLLFWAAANVQAPGARVKANVDASQVNIARDLVRRGLNETALDAYRAGQAVALRRWTEICFALTTDHDELRELLDVSSRSIAAFVDDTIAGIAEQIARERQELTSGSHAERLETVSLILDGAPIPVGRAEQRLGYRLAGEHTAAVVWSEGPDAELADLDRAAELVAGHGAGHVAGHPGVGGDPRPLTVLAGAGTRWVWVHGRPDREQLRSRAADIPGVRIAVGSTGDGVDGFRRSHLDALTVQRMLDRLSSPHQVASHDEVELVALLTADPKSAGQFVRRVLGGLETAEPEITEAVRAFVAAQCNASHAASRLYVHRNTLLRRLARADQLLPRPLASSVVDVAAALEVLRWRTGA
ncbi:PucR family transcriptional regulator [Streptacidiphilus sp. MAP5-3]|uniref:PucR family transcriptional regulator n=1 Tax=unclassified Streptacidiphilus TaxID=2643834 RepID=UPI0035119B2D